MFENTVIITVPFVGVGFIQDCEYVVMGLKNEAHPDPTQDTIYVGTSMDNIPKLVSDLCLAYGKAMELKRNPLEGRN